MDDGGEGCELWDSLTSGFAASLSNALKRSKLGEHGTAAGTGVYRLYAAKSEKKTETTAEIVYRLKVRIQGTV